tara:strand:- start:57 stop:437 length:381 start_codon:yes stop_codon:yes gene_type:complete
MIKFTKLQAELLADRPPDCIADCLNQTYDWDFDFIDDKATSLNYDIEQRQTIDKDLDKYDLEILHDMVDGNTIMQRLIDAAEFEEYITKKELGNYKRAFKSLIKKLNKLGEGHESFPIQDSWMLYY